MRARVRVGGANAGVVVLVAVAFGGCLPPVEVTEHADGGVEPLQDPDPPKEPPPGYHLPDATPHGDPDGGTPLDVAAPDGGVPPRNGEDPDGPTVVVPVLPLTVVGTRPPAAAVEVSIEQRLGLTFSAAIDPASLSGLTIELVRSNALPITGTLSVLEGEVSVHPSEPLILDNDYVLRFRGSLRSTAGAEWTGSGEVPFQTRVGQWALPENIAPSGDNPRIAFAGPNDALAVWNQLDATPSHAAAIGVSRFTAADGWQSLPSPGSCGPLCSHVLVAGGADGTFETVWFAQDNVSARPYHPDFGFGELETISARSGPIGVDATVSDGELWLAANVSQGIVASHRVGDAAWQASNAFISDDRSTSSAPVIVADAAGRARVFWIEDSQLLASTFSAGSWSAPQFVPHFGGYVANVGFSGAGVPSGDAVLAWAESRPTDEDPAVIESVLSVVRMSASGVIEEEGTPPLPNGIAGNATTPVVAVNSRGEALLAWRQTSGNPDDGDAPPIVLGAFHSASATTWSAALPLTDELDGTPFPPAVGLDPSGNGHLLWVAYGVGGGSEGSVLTARFNRDTGLFEHNGLISAAAPVSVTATEENPRSGNENCQLAVDVQGRAIAIWAAPDGGIWAARFE
jgi:Big-like domain-containing protein